MAFNRQTVLTGYNIALLEKQAERSVDWTRAIPLPTLQTHYLADGNQWVATTKLAEALHYNKAVKTKVPGIFFATPRMDIQRTTTWATALIFIAAKAITGYSTYDCMPVNATQAPTGTIQTPIIKAGIYITSIGSCNDRGNNQYNLNKYIADNSRLSDVYYAKYRYIQYFIPAITSPGTTFNDMLEIVSGVFAYSRYARASSPETTPRLTTVFDPKDYLV